MRQIQSVTNLRCQVPLPTHKNRRIKPRIVELKPKPLGAKQASSLKGSSPQSFSKHGKNELAGASGDIKFNELNRARANALG